MSHPMNGFRYIHKAIRHELDALEELGGRQGGEGLQTAVLAERLGFLREVVRIHAAGEDEGPYPDLDGRVPQVTRSYALDHQFEETLFDQVEAALARLRTAPAGNGQGEPARLLHRRLIALNATLSLHIWKEEEQLLPLLDEHYSLEQEAVMAGQAVEHIPPHIMQPLLPWMLDALTADERADLLRTIGGTMPAEAFHALGTGLKAHFSPADWSAVTVRLPEMASV